MLTATTDSEKKFHPFSINVCTNETHEDFCFIFSALVDKAKQLFNHEYRANVLIADAAEAITNGFTSAFKYENHSEFTRVMCWSHVHLSLLKKVSSIQSPEDQAKMMQDIEHLQGMASPSLFDHSLKLFVEKWNKSKDSNV